VPVLVFRIRNLLQEKNNGQLDLTIPKKKRSNFFKGLIEAIYKKYIELKLGGLPSSLTTVVRDRKYYESGLEAYIAFKNMLKFPETDYIAKNSCNLK
jgi:hypothetical protein